MQKTILGISFSTRMVGLAVLESNSLIDYSVKLYKEKWSSAKMDSILTSLTSAVKRYNISYIVLSIPPIYYQAQPFQELWQEMTVRLRGLKLNVSMSRHADLQALVGSEERLSRKLLMDALVILYPELELYARIEKRNRNKYYYKMFEAVAAATLYSRKEEE